MADLSEFDSAARLLNVRQDLPEAAPRKTTHPSGWEPGVDTERGIIVHRTDHHEPPSDWTEILAELKLDPARWEVVSDRVNVRTWDAAIGGGETTRFYYYKADVRPRQAAGRADVDELCKRISRHRYTRPSSDVDTVPTSALVVCLADWQAGPDPDGLVDHVLNLKVQVVETLKTDKPDVVYVVGMGDMIESCAGHYPMQTFTVRLDHRQQVKLVRRLLVDLLVTWARYAPRVVVGCVPGNHGERRDGDGKAYTTFEDNDDLAVFEQAAEILAANPDAYDHVRFVLPDGDMSLTLDVAGTTVGFIHGHQARRGTTAWQKLDRWWKGKQTAKHPIGDADVLVNGHYHHLCLVEEGPRTWIQCPSLAQSRWFEESGGPPSATGTLTFCVGPDGWHSLQVLR